MKRQVVAQNRQMLTAVSSMQLDVDTLHSLLAAHFQEVDQVLFVPVYASLSVSLPVPASKHASRLLPIFCSPLLSLRLLTSGLTKKWRQQRASCRKSAWQTPSAKFGDFHAALKRHQGTSCVSANQSSYKQNATAGKCFCQQAIWTLTQTTKKSSGHGMTRMATELRKRYGK